MLCSAYCQSIKTISKIQVNGRKIVHNGTNTVFKLFPSGVRLSWGHRIYKSIRGDDIYPFCFKIALENKSHIFFWREHIYVLIFKVVKTRLQLQGEKAKPGTYQKSYKGVVHSFIQIYRYDGWKGLQKGLIPALGFQFTLNALR